MDRPTTMAMPAGRCQFQESTTSSIPIYWTFRVVAHDAPIPILAAKSINCEISGIQPLIALGSAL